MKGRLYFENSQYQRILVVEDIEEDQVHSHILGYVRKLNPKFKIPYVRMWTTNGITTYDVGSHVEFFLFVPEGVEFPSA